MQYNPRKSIKLLRRRMIQSPFFLQDNLHYQADMTDRLGSSTNPGQDACLLMNRGKLATRLRSRTPLDYALAIADAQ